MNSLAKFKDDLEHRTLVPPPTKFWDCKHAPLYPDFAVLGIKPKGLVHASEDSTEPRSSSVVFI